MQKKILSFIIYEGRLLALYRNPVKEHGKPGWFVVTGSIESGESFVLTDLYANFSYQLEDNTIQKIKLSLSINNLFDKVYLADSGIRTVNNALGFTAPEFHYGTPRTWTASLSVEF